MSENSRRRRLRLAVKRSVSARDGACYDGSIAAFPPLPISPSTHRMRLFRSIVGLWFVFALATLRATAGPTRSSSIKTENCAHARAGRGLKSQLHKVALPSGYDDVRAYCTCIRPFRTTAVGRSRRSWRRPTRPACGVILFTEHPASHYDYINDGHHGLNDGVLLIPGAETDGFLAYPKRSLAGQKAAGPQAFADLVRETGGMTFLCHLEERMDWDIAGLTGSEIYNTHADFKDEPKFLATLASPVGMLKMAPAVRDFPQETFAALQDYPADYLKRYDQLCQREHLTGVSANDAHHNQAYKASVVEGGKLQLVACAGQDGRQARSRKGSHAQAAGWQQAAGRHRVRDRSRSVRRSFHHVSTHLLMRRADGRQRVGSVPPAALTCRSIGLPTPAASSFWPTPAARRFRWGATCRCHPICT